MGEGTCSDAYDVEACEKYMPLNVCGEMIDENTIMQQICGQGYCPEIICGDGKCEGDEDTVSCPEDCPFPTTSPTTSPTTEPSKVPSAPPTTENPTISPTKSPHTSAPTDSPETSYVFDGDCDEKPTNEEKIKCLDASVKARQGEIAALEDQSRHCSALFAQFKTTMDNRNSGLARNNPCTAELEPCEGTCGNGVCEPGEELTCYADCWVKMKQNMCACVSSVSMCKNKCPDLENSYCKDYFENDICANFGDDDTAFVDICDPHYCSAECVNRSEYETITCLKTRLQTLEDRMADVMENTEDACQMSFSNYQNLLKTL